MTTLIYQHLVRTESDPNVIDRLLAKGWTLQPAAPAHDPATHRAEWKDGAWVVSAIVPYIPPEVQTWALDEAIAEAGKTAELQAVLDALPATGGTRAKAKTRWAKKPTIRRNTSLFNSVKQAVGWTDAFIDGLFVRAEQLAAE